MQIILKQPEIERLNALLGDVPFKYAAPIMTYLSELLARQEFESTLPQKDDNPED